MKNIGLKLFSLVIAFLISYYVNSDTNEGVIGITVPIELKGLPTQKVVLWPVVRKAEVSIKGPSFLLSQIYSTTPTFQVKVPPDVGNRFVASLNKNNLGLPPSVSILRIEPSEVEFTLDTLLKKEVPVQVVQFGELKDGLKLSEIVIKPNKVTISGSQSEISSINIIETEPVDIRDLSSDVEKDLNLKVSSKISNISANVVRVKIVVSTLNIERLFENVPVEVRSLSGEMAIVEPESVTIELSGPKEKVSALKKEDIVPYIRLNKGLIDGSEYKVQVDLPKSISLVMIEPEVVKILKSPAPAKKPVKGDGVKR